MAKIIQFPPRKPKKPNSEGAKPDPPYFSDVQDKDIDSDVTLSRLIDEIEIIKIENINDLPRKISLIRQAISRVSKNKNPFLWGVLHNDLAASLTNNPFGDQADNIEDAIRCYEKALEVRTRDVMPEEWAATLMNRAVAFSKRIHGDRATNIEEAIRCHKQALEVMTRDAMPVYWAMTMMNIGRWKHETPCPWNGL